MLGGIVLGAGRGSGLDVGSGGTLGVRARRSPPGDAPVGGGVLGELGRDGGGELGV
jgi:hypothetical protein